MSIELVKERFTTDKVVARVVTQIIAKDSREIPAAEPGLRSGSSSSVLKVTGKAFADEIRVSEDTAEVDGHIDVTLLYTAEGDPWQIGRYEVEPVPFSKAVEIEGMTEDLIPNIRLDIESLDIIARSAKEFEVEAVINTEVSGINKESNEVVTNISGVSPDNVAVQSEPLRIADSIGTGAAEFKVTATKSLPSGRPPIKIGDGTVVDTYTKAKVVEAIAQDDKIRVEGELDLTVLYQADPDYSDPAYPIYSVTYPGIEFSGNIDVDRATPHCSVESAAEVTKMEVTRMTADVFDIQGSVRVEVNVSDVRDAKVVVGIEARGDEVVDVETKVFRPYNILREESVETMVSGIAELPEGFPPIYNGEEPGILAKKAEVRVTGCRAEDQSIFVEGLIDLEMMYVEEPILDDEFQTSKDVQPLRFSQLRGIPFDYEFEIPEAVPGMIAEAKAAVVDVDIDPTADYRRIEYSVVVGLRAKLLEMNQYDTVSNCELVTPVERDPAVITYYVVQSGDTLWKVARRYKVTVDSLVKKNRLDDEEEVTPGRKLLIPAI